MAKDRTITIHQSIEEQRAKIRKIEQAMKLLTEDLVMESRLLGNLERLVKDEKEETPAG